VSSVLFQLKYKKIDERYYTRFKASLRRHFPEFLKIIYEIEKTFYLDRARNYLKERQEEVNKIRTLEDLYELVVISFFLPKNNDDISRRYLEHAKVYHFKIRKDDCLEISYISTFDVFQFLEHVLNVSVN
jgi:hypothetical protein